MERPSGEKLGVLDQHLVGQGRRGDEPTGRRWRHRSVVALAPSVVLEYPRVQPARARAPDQSPRRAQRKDIQDAAPARPDHSQVRPPTAPGIGPQLRPSGRHLARHEPGDTVGGVALVVRRCSSLERVGDGGDHPALVDPRVLPARGPVIPAVEHEPNCHGLGVLSPLTVNRP